MNKKLILTIIWAIAVSASQGWDSYQYRKDQKFIIGKQLGIRAMSEPNVLGAARSVGKPEKVHEELEVYEVTAAKVDVEKAFVPAGVFIEPVIQYKTQAGCKDPSIPNPGTPVPPPPGTQPPEKPDWSYIKVRAGEANDLTQAAQVLVCIADTGIDFTHPDLKDAVVGGRNFTGGDPNDYMDRFGHGTHVAGIVAARSNNIGTRGIVQAKLYGLKVLGDNGSGDSDNIMKGILHGIEAGCDVINGSFGSPTQSQAIGNAIFEAAKNGIFFTAAAGNDGMGRLNFPAAFAPMIPGLFAITATDMNDMLARFSSYGHGTTYAAPGVNVNSTYLKHGYSVMSGTSMASPVAAAIVAIAIAQGTTVKAIDLKDPLKYGFGRVDALLTAKP